VIKIPFVKEKTSISLAFSAAILLLMMITPLLLFNLQPVQASSTIPAYIRISGPADGHLCTGDEATLSFDAQGIASSNNTNVNISSRTFQVTSGDSDNYSIVAILTG
jgi:hypothetical protein